MNILITADMEGISGVVDPSHVTPGHLDYERFRKIMTADVNSAIEGAIAGGATEIVVTDGHGGNLNILIEDLHPAARLNAGGPTPLAMVQGIGDHVDGVFFVGYHAMAGTQNAILDHTWSSEKVIGVRLNDRECGEIALNAAVCGHFGVPVVMISGDQTACAEAKKLLHELEAAIVKHATGRHSAACLPLEQAQSKIKEAACRSLLRLSGGSLPKPYTVDPPVTVKVQFTASHMADRAALMPGARRIEKTRVAFTADDMVTAYQGMRVMIG